MTTYTTQYDPLDISEETLEETQQNPTQTSSETYMVGFIIVNIVGIQYYTGRISGRELVGLVREPLNMYDENAIKVLNTRGTQVGHIERGAAKVLSPLIDCGYINVEGIVPNVSKNGGNRFRIACQVHVFAREEVFGVVKDRILEGGLQLVCQESAVFSLSEAAVVKERGRGEEDGRSVDEVFRLVNENVGRVVDEGLVPPKEVICTELFEHQKVGLGWMVMRERSNELPPFWEVKEKEGLFVNVLTNYQTSVRPEPIKGGIFADDMGLGKTLTLLALIAYDKVGGGGGSSSVGVSDGKAVDIDCGVVEEEDGIDGDAGSKKTKRGRKSKVANTSRASGGMKKRKVDDNGSGGGGNKTSSSTGSESKTTLVVCPPSVFSTWITQLCDHTIRGSLKMYMYHGPERTKDVEVLKKHDIVLTTYSTLAVEESQTGSPVKKMEWRRIILDEGHMIKNPEAQQSRAVRALIGDRRWVVSGTPIQNSSYDLFSLMAFLKFDPFSNKSYWNRLIQRPLAQGDKKALERLQVLMATVSLRRTKDQNVLELPPKSLHICHVELLPEEKDLYDRLEEEAKKVVQKYINDGSVTRNYSTVLSIILRLRQICNDVALCPHDIKSLLPADNVGDVSNNPELLEKMVAVLQEGEDFDCPICISPPTDVVITICAHIFCKSCIVKTLKRTKPNCPMCRHHLSESDLFLAPPSESSDGANTGSSSRASTKVSVLLKLLSESKDKNEDVKSVVFSQFQKMLVLLEGPLKAAGFKILRLDGTMTPKKRAQVIEEFRTLGPDSPTVLLASLKACGTGINLTSASVVYLLEPWWNPAAEEQAMDRVHRIGQKKNVKVVRIIARNTIEERVLDLQEKKKELARGAFGIKGSKQKKEVNVEDLRTLMSL